uniref:THAP-type domain-containing protein n=4 Tax=Lygus hesperus TaxID=30085 RepID=A0A0K8TBQ9_LYGHE
MWKSLLSVPTITSDSYVCTRHFTANDYTVNVLNKVAVPTQFLPTPVTFAPCKVQDKTGSVQPPPLVLLNKSKNPPPILRKPVRPALTYASPPIRFPGIPSVNKVGNLTPVVFTRTTRPTPSKIFRQIRPSTSQYRLPATAAPRPTVPVVRATPPPPPPPPVVKKVKLGCSITGCVNKENKEQSKGVLFRLPHNIEKCKEWVYSCGHPEWLDKGMISARSMYRICSLHFASEMFLDANHKTLKGSAKPTVNVQEPYKKCVVKHCHNYYDKERLHYIGVDFATFPTEPQMFNSWVKSVKNNTGVPAGTINVTEEDVTNYTGAVICSLHFRNSDYVAGPNGKGLSSKAIPTMNLVFVKEPQNTPSTLTEEPIIVKATPPPEYDDEDVQYVVPKNRRPYFRSRRGRKKRRHLWMKVSRNTGGNEEIDETKDTEGQDGSQPTLEGEKSSVLSAEGEQVAEDHDEPRISQLAPSRRGRGGRRPRGGRRGRRSAKLPTDEEESEEELDQSSRRRSSRIETLYGPSGRPLRTAVLKRKSVVESGNESQDSDEDSPAVKRGRKQRRNSTDSDVSLNVRRSLRPRRAARGKKFIMDDSDSEEPDRNDDWQQESENCAPVNYGGGVAEGGHFLDPVLGIEPFQEEPAENISGQPVENTAKPAEQENVSIDLNVAQQRETVTMSSDVEERINEEAEETTNHTPNDAEAIVTGECEEGRPSEVSTVDNNMDNVDTTMDTVDTIMDTVDTNKKTSVVIDSKENVDDDVEPVTQEGTKDNEMETNHSSDAPKEVEEEKEVEEGIEIKEGKEAEEMEEGKEEESIDKNPVEPPVSQDSKTDDPTHNSSSEGNRLKQLLEDFETVIPFGPKLPFPTQADMEFFRSIIPTMATFNQLQKSELRTTIVATLKELLNEELNIEVMNFKTDESVKDDCPVPNVDAVQSI